MKSFSLLLVGVFFLSGCGEKKVDSTSDESLKASISTVKESLTEQKRKKLEEAITVLSLSSVGNLFEVAANPDGIQRKMKEILHDKTADQIIAESDNILAERKVKEKEQAAKEIKEIKTDISTLEKQKLDAEKAKDELKKFTVLRSRYNYEKNEYYESTTIELTVKNNTKHAISRAYFDGVLTSPGRTIPWVVDSFNYSIAGGLEAGEEVTWKLSMNRFGAWSKAPKDRDDMVLTVSVNRIDGADKKAIFNSAFSESNKNKLVKLNKRLEKLNNLLKL